MNLTLGNLKKLKKLGFNFSQAYKAQKAWVQFFYKIRYSMRLKPYLKKVI